VIAAPASTDVVRDEDDLALNFAPELIESMSTDAIVGLLLLRMRALTARGFDPCEALFAAVRIEQLAA
jgi:hypothetical protein